MEASTSPATAELRQRFGDRKIPEISRKITACVACRKQKIKCHMQADGKPPCVRCKKRGLPCAVNRSLQMILENDASWKLAIEQKVDGLKAAVERIVGRLGVEEGFLGKDDDDDDDDDDDAVLIGDGDEGDDEGAGEEDKGRARAQPQSDVSAQSQSRAHANEKHASSHNFEIVMDPDAGPAAIPGSVVSPVTLSTHNNATHTSHHAQSDLITRGILTLSQAQSYLNIYQDRLDHFLYRILGDRKTLREIRSSSPLLLAAICTVGALHSATSDFEKLHREFISLAGAQMFAYRNDIDDVRGFCIAAFWLSGISWTCVGAAVRIATEIQLHRSIFKALHGDRTHYLRTRLYYLVYVCDHHFSVAYGRPPMTRQCDAVRAATQFLETEHAVEDDLRLISQVQFWSVGASIYETFGVDVERPLDSTMISQLRRFGIELDKIRSDWTERFIRNQYVGNYPKKGVGLHYHFAKLYLYSMAFRGIGKPSFKAPEVALDIDEIANAALLSATAILRAIVTDAEIQNYLNGLPTYFDLMIAFAVVFVLKVSTKYANFVRIDTSEIRVLVDDLVTVLKNVTADMHPRHLLVSVARGAEKLLQGCSNNHYQQPPTSSYSISDLHPSVPVPANAHVTLMNQQPLPHQQQDFDQFNGSMGWDQNSLENFSMGYFDFLAVQDFSHDGFSPGFQF